MGETGEWVRIMREIKKCEGSQSVQMVDWMPDSKPTEEFPKGYPGAAICIHCSHGVILQRGTVHEAVSKAGYEGHAGTLRTHWIEIQSNDQTSSDDIVKMAYRKSDLIRS